MPRGTEIPLQTVTPAKQRSKPHHPYPRNMQQLPTTATSVQQRLPSYTRWLPLNATYNGYLCWMKADVVWAMSATISCVIAVSIVDIGCCHLLHFLCSQKNKPVVTSGKRFKIFLFGCRADRQGVKKGGWSSEGMKCEGGQVQVLRSKLRNYKNNAWYYCHFDRTRPGWKTLFKGFLELNGW